MRGVLPLNQFSLGKSTRRSIRKAGFTITFDKAFSGVMEACHQARLQESWIHPLMKRAYGKAHEAGFAHSVEVWQGEELVGGLYGIDSGRFFSGESMFHKRSNAGKAAIEALVERCTARGDRILDIQQLTPHMRALGAESWRRDHFLELLQEEREKRNPEFF